MCHSVIALTLVVRGGTQFLPAGNTYVYRHLPGNSPSSRLFQATVCVFMIGVLYFSPIRIQFSFPFSLTTQQPLTTSSQQNWELDKDVFWVQMHVCLHQENLSLPPERATLCSLCLMSESWYSFRSESEHLMSGTCEHSITNS